MSDRPRRIPRQPKYYDDEMYNGSAGQGKPPPPSPPISSGSTTVTESPEFFRFDTPTIRSKSSSTTPGAAKPTASNYRHCLLANKIMIDPKICPPSIQDYSHSILTMGRSSPQISMEAAQKISDSLRSANEKDEDSIRMEYACTGVMEHPYKDALGWGSSVPMSWLSLPRINTAPLLPVPKPDMHYCFNAHQFTEEQHLKNMSTTLAPYANPSSAGFWPYLTIEFKSDARGGTLFTAENQNAGNGALCVNTMRQLLKKIKSEPVVVDTISFSCNINARRAAVWVHFCNENEMFCSREVSEFDMHKVGDVIQFNTSLKNIHQFALETRLMKIKEVLDQISMPDLEAEEKAKRARCASQVI